MQCEYNKKKKKKNVQKRGLFKHVLCLSSGISSGLTACD